MGQDNHSLRHRCLLLAGLALLAAVAVLVATASMPEPERLFGRWRLRHVALAAGLAVVAGGLLCRAFGRQILFGYVTVALTVLAFLGGLELAAALGVLGRLLPAAGGDGAAIGWELQPGLDVSGETRQDIATRLGLDSDPIGFRFQTDGYGFRNGGDPEGRIVVLGDSIVLGAAVPREETVAERLEALTGVPAMQAALLGLSVQEEQRMLLASGLPLAGKTVVQVVFEGNDLLDSRRWREAAETPEPAPPRRSPLRMLWAWLVRVSNPPAAYETCEIGDRTHAFLWTRRSFAGVEDEVDPIVSAIAGFERELAARDARLVLVLVPTKYRVLAGLCRFPPQSIIADPERNLSDLPDRLAAWAGETGIAYLDLTPALTEAAAGGAVPWFWGDTHWNATGHAVAAEAIAGSGILAAGD